MECYNLAEAKSEGMELREVHIPETEGERVVARWKLVTVSLNP